MTKEYGSPRRGDVWVVDFGEPVGHEQGFRRPAVVVSSDRMNTSRAKLSVVVPVTTTHRRLPSHVEIEPGASGLSQISYAKVEDVKSISHDRLTRRLGNVDPDRLSRIVRVLALLVEL